MFSASTKIEREEWGLTWNAPLETGGWLVGKTVNIELEIQAAKAG
jgi:polyisoprenoid-binding protein YceI